MIEQDPISHHFVPVFYLKVWAAEDGRVTRYYRPMDAVVASPIAPKNTGYEDYLYTLQGVQPEHQAIIETQFFKPVDTQASVVHKLLIKGDLNQLTNEQRVHWARFMMSMQLRSPFSLGELERLVDKNLRETTYSLEEKAAFKSKSGEPDNIYDWTAKHQPHVIENAYKQFLPRLIDHEGLGHYLVNMHWATIDVSRATHTLLTGDRPFIATHGWKNPNATLLFPLSPDCLFVATNGTSQTAQVLRKSPNQLVRFANNQIAGCAADFVYGTNAAHHNFVEKRLRRLDQEPVPGPIGKGRPNCPA